MQGKFLLIDVSSLAYRFFHVLGDLSYGVIRTGAIFGTLKQVHELMDLFSTRNVAWCFDVGDSKRVEMFDGYKASRRCRRLYEDDLSRAKTHLDLQIDHLRRRYLPAIGYQNIFSAEGYEADDLIAAICQQEGDFVIVSSDHDFYQLLRPGVRQWLPGKHRTVTYQSFIEQYRIVPEQWVRVKAMTGCDTDEIPGIEGVGESTAIKYVRGELKSNFKTYARLIDPASRITIERNRQLIKLPLLGTPMPKLRADQLSIDGWHKVCTHLGMASLHDALPPGLRK